jgi:hypothetical protein
MIRNECQQKGFLKSSHRTFSLLPSFLVPYHKHDLDTMVDTLNHQNQDPKPSLVQTIDLISALGLNDDIPLENSQIHHFRNIFEQAFYKIVSIPELKNLISYDKNPLESILDIIEHYKSPFHTTTSMNASNVQQLAWDFFFNFQITPFFDRQFLFGTPSQKRF